MDSPPSPLALRQALGPPKPQPTIQSPPENCSNRLEVGGYCSSGQPPGASRSWGCFSPRPVPSTCHTGHQQHPVNLQSCRKSTQLSLLPNIAIPLGFTSKKQAHFPNWVQAAVCFLFPALNHDWRNGDKLQSYSQGRSCHHQHRRDGPEKRLKPFPPRLRADFII